MRRLGLCDEFLGLNFPTPSQLADFAHHPFMAKLSRELLEPLHRLYGQINTEFSWSRDAKMPVEWELLRVLVRDYLDLASRLADFIIRYEELALLRRVPAPPVPWILCVMRAESVYGFVGDDLWITWDILRGKMTALRRRVCT
ncbi:hypothetical protein C8R44DRAFT_896530 [Mycena epipterygia]|nr:hypothetical protein C8R44DRAFT_896530 [Mycena epipterygia]